jgi:hypothetical protein
MPSRTIGVRFQLFTNEINQELIRDKLKTIAMI